MNHPTVSLLLGADDRATARIHTYTPSAELAALTGSSAAPLALTAITVAGVTLQWDDPHHARLFLGRALDALNTERDRYLSTITGSSNPEERALRKLLDRIGEAP